MHLMKQCFSPQKNILEDFGAFCYASDSLTPWHTVLIDLCYSQGSRNILRSLDSLGFLYILNRWRRRWQLREVAKKKRISYGQADRKHLPPLPLLRSAFCEHFFGCVIMILCVPKWIPHQKSHFHPTTRFPNSSLGRGWNNQNWNLRWLSPWSGGGGVWSSTYLFQELVFLKNI